MRLERDGEIGLSEYAPGSEIVADGKLFKSGGIDLQHKELERRQYRVCNMCRRVEFFAESQPGPEGLRGVRLYPEGATWSGEKVRAAAGVHDTVRGLGGGA